MESVKKAVGRKRGAKLEASKEQRLVCTIPFLVVKYHPENIELPEDSIILHRKKMKLTSVRPLKCYGDSTILSKMKLQELGENESYEEDVLSLLGSHGPTIPDTIKRIDESINQIQDKYSQLREQSCKWLPELSAMLGKGQRRARRTRAPCVSNQCAFTIIKPTLTRRF